MSEYLELKLRPATDGSGRWHVEVEFIDEESGHSYEIDGGTFPETDSALAWFVDSYDFRLDEARNNLGYND